MRNTFSAVPLILLACSITRGQQSPAQQACAGPLSAPKKAELADYFRKKFDLPAQFSFALISDEAARAAAEGAACAQLQNSASFWSIHDKLFDGQREITESNVRERLLEFAHETKTWTAPCFRHAWITRCRSAWFFGISISLRMRKFLERPPYS